MNRPSKALPLDLIFTHIYASDNRFLRDVGLSGWLGWQGLPHIIRRLHAITPAVTEPATRYRNPQLRELFLSGLRLAVGETG